MTNSKIDMEQLNQMCQDSLVSHLGIKLTESGPDYLKGTMPVDRRTQQPYGILHGGASVVLAETLGSLAANLRINQETHYCVGLEINANHVKAVSTGVVTGVAKAVHMGKRTQIWEIRIENEKAELVCISRLTMAILNKI